MHKIFCKTKPVASDPGCLEHCLFMTKRLSTNCVGLLFSVIENIFSLCGFLGRKGNMETPS